VLLTILRFVQGVGVGGEWGGSVLLAMEWALCRGRDWRPRSQMTLAGFAGSAIRPAVQMFWTTDP